MRSAGSNTLTPTAACGKAQPQPSTALRNKLWPVQTEGAWTDTQQPHQGSCSVPAAEPKHHPGINSKKEKSRKNPCSLYPDTSMGRQLPESPSDTTTTAFSCNLKPLWLPQHHPACCRPRNKQTVQQNTFKPVFSLSDLELL